MKILEKMCIILDSPMLWSILAQALFFFSLSTIFRFFLLHRHQLDIVGLNSFSE